MILLEVHNRIIEELLTVQIETFLRKDKLVEVKTNVVGRSAFEHAPKKDVSCSFSLDFDGALYQVTHARDKPFTVSIKLKFFHELEPYGTEAVSNALSPIPYDSEAFELDSSP